jgi:hypothetical protein
MPIMYKRWRSFPVPALACGKLHYIIQTINVDSMCKFVDFMTRFHNQLDIPQNEYLRKCMGKYQGVTFFFVVKPSKTTLPLQKTPFKFCVQWFMQAHQQLSLVVQLYMKHNIKILWWVTKLLFQTSKMKLITLGSPGYRNHNLPNKIYI